MAIYYVDKTTGNDSDTGLTEELAWETINKVNISSFNAGDSILFKKGEEWGEQLTFPSSGSDGNPIIIGAYGSGDNPKIFGTDDTTGGSWVDLTGNVWRKNIGSGEPKVLVFNGSVLGTNDAAPTANYEWTYSNPNLDVYAESNPNGYYSQIEAAYRDYAVFTDGKNYLTISDLLLEATNYSGFRASGSSTGIVLSGVESRFSYNSGFTFQNVTNLTLTSCNANYNGIGQGKYGYDFWAASGTVDITSCDAGYNGNKGVQVNSGTTATFTFIGGEYHHHTIGDEADGITIDGNDNLFFYAVYCHHNSTGAGDGDGIHLIGCSNPFIRHCTFYNNWQGIMMNGADGGEVLYNLFVGGGTNGLVIEGNVSNTLDIYNNTFYDNGNQGLFFYNLSVDATVNVKNNIFFVATGNTYATQLANGIADTNIAMDFNCYYDQDASGDFIEWNGNVYSQAQFSSYQSTESQDADSIVGDPLMVNPGAFEFALRSASPCRDAGVDVGQTEDWAGNPVPQGSAPEIGAHELPAHEYLLGFEQVFV